MQWIVATTPYTCLFFVVLDISYTCLLDIISCLEQSLNMYAYRVLHQLLITRQFRCISIIFLTTDSCVITSFSVHRDLASFFLYALDFQMSIVIFWLTVIF